MGYYLVVNNYSRDINYDEGSHDGVAVLGIHMTKEDAVKHALDITKNNHGINMLTLDEETRRYDAGCSRMSCGRGHENVMFWYDPLLDEDLVGVFASKCDIPKELDYPNSSKFYVNKVLELSKIIFVVRSFSVKNLELRV